MKTRLTFELPSDIHAIEDAVDYVLDRCESCRAHASDLRLNLRVGLTEAISNAMLYGNGRDPGKRVRLEVELGPDSLVARVTDEGNGFDPEAVPDPTTPENLEKVGGRGLFLMRQLMDEVRYNEQGNSVTLVLRLVSSDGMAGEARA